MLQNILLGASLAVDASIVSMTNGLVNPKLKITKTILLSLVFGLFQMVMPLIGFLIGSIFKDLIVNLTPWIALMLLLTIGIQMITKKESDELNKELSIKELLIEATATSIDALVVGIIFINNSFLNACLAFLIFGIVTVILCLFAFNLGKKFGILFKRKAETIGGIVLIIIGIKIFIEYLLTIIL